jgi:tRNA uridine 5-carboxymethylaminomethyl modification enzyme
MAAMNNARTRLAARKLSPKELATGGILVNQDGVRRSALDVLGLPDMTLDRVAEVFPEVRDLDPALVEQLQTDSRYAGYVERQEAEIRAFRRDEGLHLPADLAYEAVGGLSNEVRQKLSRAMPATLGAASRIPGVTPAALTALLRHVRRDPAPTSKAS